MSLINKVDNTFFSCGDASASPFSVLSSPKVDSIGQRIINGYANIVVKSVDTAQSSKYILPSAELISSASLESLFVNRILEIIDVHATIDFDDFLIPNEFSPFSIKEHLDLIEEPGLYVTTGTERAFFGLSLFNPEKCRGMVVIDINPRVIAYVNFNIMLLRISKDRFEYQALSEFILPYSDRPEEEMESRLLVIKEKLLSDNDIPEPIKTYYLSNLEDFGSIYFLRIYEDWRSEKNDQWFQGVQYYNDDRLFQVLQYFAKEGKIITILGDINNLHFLDGQKIAVVDISNIDDYALIDLRGDENFHPRVISTCMFSAQHRTEYYSFIYQPLSLSQRSEMYKILDLLSIYFANVCPEMAAQNFCTCLKEYLIKKNEKREEMDIFNYPCVSYSSMFFSKVNYLRLKAKI